MKSFIFTLLSLVLFLSINAQDDTKKNSKLCKEEKQAEQVKKVQALIENKSFVFSVRQAVPLCGDPVSVDFIYSLKLDDGLVSSYLPFYGFESDLKIFYDPLKSRQRYQVRISDGSPESRPFPAATLSSTGSDRPLPSIHRRPQNPFSKADRFRREPA